VVVTIVRGQDEGISRVVVNNVQVLTAGTRYDQEKAREDGKPMPTSVVTLLVTPEDAERIALAQSQGWLTLTLRNPLDTAPAETVGVRMANLMGAPNPSPVAKTVQGQRVMRTPKPAPTASATPKVYTVETIRGAKRTEEEIR
jgi:pilus assembly protein CpaB